MSFLNFDSPFMESVRKLTDCIWLSFLWIIASIPVFTFGAATTAMYYTAENQIHTNSGCVWKTFWNRFGKEFKQATGLWLVGLLITIPLALNTLLLWKASLHAIIFALLLASVIFGTGWMLLWYGYLSRFEDTTKVLLINTFRIALVSFPKLILLIAITAAAVAVTVFFFFFSFPVMVIIPGIYVGLSNILLRSIFKRYITEPDEPTPDKI